MMVGGISATCKITLLQNLPPIASTRTSGSSGSGWAIEPDRRRDGYGFILENWEMRPGAFCVLQCSSTVNSSAPNRFRELPISTASHNVDCRSLVRSA